jgi:hypothetical protein
MNESVGTVEQLRFAAIAGHTVRAYFDGGAMSSAFGALMLRGVDRQIGLTQRLAAALTDRRHPSYVEHSLPELLSQRIYQVACGYEDQIDANALRHDPMFKLSVGHVPCDAEQPLASQSTHSRLENSVRRKDVYRTAVAFIEQFVASYVQPPPILVLEFDHSEDPTHGQQAFSFYNAHYRQHCYLPLLVCEGLSGRLVTAILRPGKTPTDRENAAILKRILKILRAHWPDTPIVGRGDGHFSTPELMDLIDQDPQADFVFGLSGNKVLNRWAQPVLVEANRVHRRRCEHAKKAAEPPPPSTRLYEERSYQAGSWSKPRRVILKAEVMALGDTPRFVVTSLARPTPQTVYEQRAYGTKARRRRAVPARRSCSSGHDVTSACRLSGRSKHPKSHTRLGMPRTHAPIAGCAARFGRCS